MLQRGNPVPKPCIVRRLRGELAIDLQRLVPEISADDLVDAPSGVRAQAVLPNGELADDFVIAASGRVLNVCNAPSPAATSCLKIGEEIVDRLSQQLAAA